VSGTRPRAAALATALAAALLAAAAAPARAQEPEARLEALRGAIEERQERVAAYEAQEDSLFDAIEAVEAAARAVAREVDRARAAAREAVRAAERIRAEEAALAARVAGTRDVLARRAVALYKAGGAGPVRVIFAPGSLRDRLGRIQVMQRLLDRDRVLLERFDAEQRALGAAREEAKRAAARRERAQQRFAARQLELARERAGKQDLLLRVRQDRSRERALLNELEEAAEALEAEFAALQRDREAPAAIPFGTLRGQLDAPVPGRLLRGFGRIVDEEYRTQTFRKGVDFQVTPGEPVAAVAAGTVRYAGWFSGYGRMVILDHGGGWFTVSGHLESFSVSVGDAVRAGDVIGSAGETGSLTGPRLYFEIRQGAVAQDPKDWLQHLW